MRIYGKDKTKPEQVKFVVIMEASSWEAVLQCRMGSQSRAAFNHSGK